MPEAQAPEALTDTGLVRAANQDAAVAEALPGGAILLAVADGLGGHAGGEVASDLAIGALASSLRASGGEPPEAALRRAFAAANEAVRARRRGELASMCTTLVAAVAREGAAHVAHTGDSRAYLVVGGEARRLTLDHSWVEEEIRAGRLDPACHPMAVAACAAMARATALALAGEPHGDVLASLSGAAARRDEPTAELIRGAIAAAADGEPPERALARLEGWRADEAIAAARVRRGAPSRGPARRDPRGRQRARRQRQHRDAGGRAGGRAPRPRRAARAVGRRGRALARAARAR